MRHNLALLALACGLLGCQPGAPEPEPDAEPRTSVIGEPLHEALDRAESVQQTLDAQARALRRQVEEAEGNGRQTN
jgi:hypothetical protein